MLANYYDAKIKYVSNTGIHMKKHYFKSIYIKASGNQLIPQINKKKIIMVDKIKVLKVQVSGLTWFLLIKVFVIWHYYRLNKYYESLLMK